MHVVVRVTRRGEPTSVTTLDEIVPGLGFPEAARACAMHQRYRPARDVLGRDVDGRTGRFAVIFYVF